MANSIDERIVSMKFDNKQFQNGVGETLSSLDKLKKNLNFTGASKGLDEISKSANNVKFNGINDGLAVIKDRFSALEVVAIGALEQIGASALMAGKNLVKSLTLDPITDGFREYETQMNAVQTILANTSSKGTTLEEVNSALKELNTYADKTIYNFTEMTRNIGTFTAAGVDLKTSTSAIKGIANLAAVSGSSSQQASTAMYQLSQALATGKVALQDWNSVVNAGMGGQVFQDALKRTATVMGTDVDALIEKYGSFRESLTEGGWLTTEVLTNTLNQFAGAYDKATLLEQGFTEQQANDILAMAKTAEDAATKVKTFSQLMDTLKEAVGSGWAQTWQIIFGDFGEAKELFTGVSDVLGAMIGKSADARNNMLQGWKDLGGRTALIDGIKNAFDGVMQVVNAVGSAFREIFPATTSQQLMNLTNSFKELTSHLKLSQTNLDNLKSTFKGLFAILDIVKQVFSALFGAITNMIGGTDSFIDSILMITGSFGEWLTSIDNVIKQSGVLTAVFGTLGQIGRTAIEGIGSVLKNATSAITSFTKYVSSKFNFDGIKTFHDFLVLLSLKMTNVKDSADSMGTGISNTFKMIGESIKNSKFVQFLEKMGDTARAITTAIGKMMSKLAESISNVFSGDFSSIFNAIGVMSIAGIAKSISKFIDSLSGKLGELPGIVDNVKKVLNGVRGCFEEYQQKLKAEILIKIATAIGILAASIVAISLIDSKKLASSVAALGGLFAQLLTSMFIYSKIGDLKGQTLKASVVMISMSTAILIMSSAMVKIGKLDWNGIAKGIAGIGSMTAMLVLSAKALSKDGGTVVKGSAALVVFAGAIKILASACIDLSTLDWNGIAKGLVGVGGLMAEVSIFLNNTKFSSKSVVTATGLILLAGAIKILASACEVFSQLSWEGIVKGLSSVGILLTELSLFTNNTSGAKNMISIGIGLTAVAAAMNILSYAMTNFGNMSWESIAKGLTSIGVALTEITIAMKLLPNNLPITATGLVVVGGALVIISKALQNFGGMSWDSIAKGLVALGGSLGILAVGLNAMNGTLSGSAALLVAAGALSLLTPALTAMGAMSWENIIKSFIELAGVIAIFAISAAALTPIIPSMLGLGAALTLLGVAMLGVGGGLALAGAGIASLSAGLLALQTVTTTGATAIVASLTIIIEGVAAMIPQILEKIGEGIVAFAGAIKEGIPAIMECVTAVLTAVIDCIVTNTPTIINGVLQTLSSILDALIQWAPKILEQVTTLILALLKTIGDNMAKFVEAGVNIITNFILGIANSLPKIIDAAFKTIVAFINGLAEAIDKNAGPIADACLKLVDAIVKSIGTFGSKFVEAGKNAVKGFIKGLGSMMGDLFKAGASLGKKALDAAKRALDEHSPSKEFNQVGVFAGKGLVIGLNNMGKKVEESGYNMGKKALSSISNAINGITDIVNTDINSDPTIKPVLDLSEIQNAGSRISSLVGDSCNLDGSLDLATQTARSINSVTSSDNTTPNNPVMQSVSTPKQPVTLQLMLQNGKAIAEYIVDDIDSLMGNKNIINGRMAGIQ